MKIISFFKWICIYCAYYITSLLPRNKKLWLYSSLSGKFVDNAKYFFLYAQANCKDVRHVWMTDNDDVVAFIRSKGFECYNKKSFKAVLLALRAKVFVYSAYSVDVANLAYSGGTFKFNLWHGIPLKKIEYDITKGPLTFLYHPKNFQEKFRRFIFSPSLTKKHSAVLTTSEALRKIFASAFQVSEKHVLVAPYPRLMPFYWSNETLLEHIQKTEPAAVQSLPGYFQQFKNTWMYMPTWRDIDPAFISKALPDLSLLNEACKNQDILFVLKTHINTVFNADVSQFSNLLLLDRSADIYPLLPFINVLVTDYSSIFFDYALLNKPMLLYPYDLDEYLDSSREFYFDYKKIIEGMPVANSFEELLHYLQQPSDSFSKHSQYNFEDLISREQNFDLPFQFIKARIGLQAE